MCSTASSFVADWQRGCHGYKKAPPPSKQLGVAVTVCVCVCTRERERWVMLSCQGDTLVRKGLAAPGHTVVL